MSQRQNIQPPIQVAIDVSSLPFGRGVSRYTSNLVEALAAQPDVQLILFGAVGKFWAKFRSWARSLRGQPVFRAWPISARGFEIFFSRLRIPFLSFIAPSVQVVHVWEWQQPMLENRPWVVTIHDLAHMLFPQTAHPEVIRRFDALIQKLEQDEQAKIISVSESTKKDIIRLTDIGPERITVVYEALPAEAKYVPSQEEQQQVLQQLKISKPYFLFVGTTEPRKNLQRSIQAWQESAQKKGYDLVLAGAPGWDTLPDLPGLHKLGYVEAHQLSTLYRRAEGLLFPSLYEGFGLPVLEAFFHGCPVVTSKVSSLPEVAGDAAILVDPYSSEAVAEGISKILSYTPEEKKQLQSKMLKQLHTFSWDRAAQETIQVYTKAFQEKS